MLNNPENKCRRYQSKFSFGATSAIITNLGIITGLNTLAHPKLSIIAGILVVALADNIADSFGIHIYQESECIENKEIWFSTLSNFLTRIFVSLTFIILAAALPLNLAVLCSICWGLALLTIMSYAIAKERKVNPYSVIFEHIIIAIFVITLSHFIGRYIISKFKITA
jgi:VIT1/CCC1 family predicted Fe2+/Mn2+ transporter